MGYCLQLVSTLTLVVSSVSAMVHVTDYWPEVAEDLTKVSWSHATNSRAKLNKALADSTMMIEADVSLGGCKIRFIYAGVNCKRKKGG